MDDVESEHEAARQAYRDAADMLTEAILRRVAREVASFFPTADALEVEADVLDDGRWTPMLTAVHAGDTTLAQRGPSLEWEFLASMVDPLLAELGEVNGRDCGDLTLVALPGRLIAGPESDHAC